MTDKQIEDWIKELTDENEEELEAMMMGSPMMSAERSAGGTFNEGNQAAKEQDVNKRQEVEEKKKA
jgi:hypothetical protein